MNNQLYKKILPVLLAVLFIATAWELIARSIHYPALFPPLADLIKQTIKVITSDNFLSEAGTTILRGLGGFFISLFFAFILSTIASISIFCERFLHPLIILTRSIPVISLVLLALLWFSPPLLPVFIALVTMFPILYQNILTGLKQTDKKLLEMATVFGKSGSDKFLHISLPSAKTLIYDGTKTAMGFGWRAIIIGEVLAQPIHGIGTAMKQAQAYINVPELIAWTVIAIFISYLFEMIIKQIQRINIEEPLPAPGIFRHQPTNRDKIKVEITGLNKAFNDRNILNGFSEVFHSDKLNCLRAPSGKGKTTLLRLLAGLEKEEKGQILISEEKYFAYVFQDVRLLPWYTVAENIAYILKGRHLSKQYISDITYHLLEKTELTAHAHKYPHQLSGGEQQRVGLARALAMQPDILLLDEPISGLDNDLKVQIIGFLSEWLAIEKPLVIWATHEDIKMEGIPTREIVL